MIYVTGDATDPQGSGPKIIVHCCNDAGGWGAGFSGAISSRWRTPELEYRRSRAILGGLTLGDVQIINVHADIWVANLIGQHGYGRPSSPGYPFVRYDSLRHGLARVAAIALDKAASVHMPRIGCGLAGGEWHLVEPIIREELEERGVTVTVYDPSGS